MPNPLRDRSGKTFKLNSPSAQRVSSPIPTVLFVTHNLERCGVAQYGRFVFEAIAKSSNFEFCYGACSSLEDFKRLLHQTKPQVIIYNYHQETLPWVNAYLTRGMSYLIHVALMHECDEKKSHTYNKDIFDYFIFQDPTMPLTQPYHFKTGRLVPEYVNRKPLPEIFTVGTIGFGFACKGVEVLVSTVQHQCDRAKIELHLPFNEHADPEGQHTSLVLAERCRKIIYKSGIELNINHQFLSKMDLLDRMASCSINTFLYSNLRKGGISSVIDLALAVRRPIAISRCEMFRHIYHTTPSILAEERSLLEIYADGLTPLQQFYDPWSENNFIKTYNDILAKIIQLHAFPIKNINTFAHDDSHGSVANSITIDHSASQLENVPIISGELPVHKIDVRDLTIFINACILSSELHQQGMRIYHLISQSQAQQFQYHECQTSDQLTSLIQSFKNIHGLTPRNIIYHYDYSSMNWLSEVTTRFFPDQQHILVHANKHIPVMPADIDIVDVHLYLENFSVTQNENIYAHELFLSMLTPTAPLPDELTVKFLGFAILDPELQTMLMNIQREYDRASIVICLPDYEYLSDETTVAITNFVHRFKKAIWKPDIRLNFASSPQFYSDILDFLSASSINIIGNSSFTIRGQQYLASVLRIALALDRPLALSEQHIVDPDIHVSPSIRSNGSNLLNIIEYSADQREHLHKLMYYALARKTIESIIQRPKPFRFDQVFGGSIQSIGVSEVSSLNCILDDAARTLYAPIIDVMYNKIPQEMQRKIPRANVQQAFVVDTVAKIASLFEKPKILCVGSYEDTAALTLHILQFPLDALDPVHNFDLRTFCELSSTEPGCYDIIFSTSVIEHVEDDETFIRDIRYLLKPGGFGILTCDYNDHWKPGMPLPDCDWRMYTKYDLAERFMRILDDCVLVGPAHWDCPRPDFSFGDYTYTFATMVFQRSTFTKIAPASPKGQLIATS